MVVYILNKSCEIWEDMMESHFYDFFCTFCRDLLVFRNWIKKGVAVCQWIIQYVGCPTFAKNRNDEVASMKFFFVVLLIEVIWNVEILLQVCQGADLEIQVPVTDFNDPNGLYRLDYTPPIGYPEPNSTFIAADIASSISFRSGLPGTKYHFRLHYTNDTIHDWLTWTASITTSELLPVQVNT